MGFSLIFLPLLQQKHNYNEVNYNEVKPINVPTVISKCSSERKRYMSLALSKKLEMIKLSEESMLKVKIS